MQNRSMLFTTVVAVLGVLLLVGIGCQQQSDLPTGETTTDLPADTTTETTGDLAPTTESFTVDLVPEGDTATGTTDTTSSSSDTTGTSDLSDLTDTTTTDGAGLVATPVDETTSTSDGSSATSAEEEVRDLAETLSELYGTFTNKDKTPYQNYKNLAPYVTQNMQDYLDSMSKGATNDPNAPFFGRTTTALSSAVVEKKGKKTTVLVTGEQEETSGTSSSPVTIYVLYRLEFVEVDNEFLLDGLYELGTDEAI